MPYTSPRAIFHNGNEATHDCRVIPNQPTGYPGKGQVPVSVYQYKVVCSCQFEVLCLTEAMANDWRRSHLINHKQWPGDGETIAQLAPPLNGAAQAEEVGNAKTVNSDSVGVGSGDGTASGA